MKLKALALAACLALTQVPAQADVCTLFTAGSTCTFATDSSGGQVIYRNPANTFNLGSGGIKPFLTTQSNGVEVGVNSDTPQPPDLPFDTKRDNTDTFTNTFSTSQISLLDEGGFKYIQFFLDINEPNGGGQSLLSLDALRIWDSQSTADQLLTKDNLPAVDGLSTLDGFYSKLIYALGPDNHLIMDFDLFEGSGKGWDLQVLMPVSLFEGVNADSRIIFANIFGQTEGASAGDGFEEWGVRIGAGPTDVPEPGSASLAGLGLAGLLLLRRKRKGQ